MHIELRKINKTFGPVQANQDISYTFAASRIVGILGENGAGKSTLMKILSGYQPADSGEIWLDGKHVAYHGPQEALAHGIGMLQQDPLDVGAFTVLENFIYGQNDRTSQKKARPLPLQQLSDLSAQFGFSLPPDMPVDELSIAQRQQMEMVRLLALGVRALILDEPTTGISADQKDMLFATLRRLAQEGMTILLVSHKLEDVLALCDDVIVLRGGHLVGTKTLPATRDELVTLMFGQAAPTIERERRSLADAPVVMQMQAIVIHEDRLHIGPFSLDVRGGEIIGLAGLDGSGQELLLRAGAGLVDLYDGAIRVSGAALQEKAHHVWRQHGVIFGAAGRTEEGLIAGLSLVEHFALVRDTNWRIGWDSVRAWAAERLVHYQVKGRPESDIAHLSGGNQQRVLMAMLPDVPRVMLLEHPTRGLDVDSAAWIWAQLQARTAQGAALLFSSAELDELIAYSDRIIVCYAGRLRMVDDPAHMTVEHLGRMIGGI